MKRALPIAALALLAGLVAALVVALVHEPAGTRSDRAVSVRTELTPQEAQFGDTVVATVDVSGTDPSSVRVRSDFAPYAVVSTVRHAGDGSVRIVRRLRCLEVSCVPGKAVKTFRFGPARVSYGGGSTTRKWPALRVHSLITKADAAAPVLRVPAPVAAPVEYRVSPDATGYVLLALAGLLGAAGVFLLLKVGLRRVTPTRRRVPPLDQVLGELAAASSNGDSGRRRRALEELAQQLETVDQPLSAESRVLAWGPEEPKPEAISDLTSRVRKDVPR